MTRLWTVLGILALALVMTPKFFPGGTLSPPDSEISQTINEPVKSTSTHKKDEGSFLARLMKRVRGHSDATPLSRPAKRL